MSAPGPARLCPSPNPGQGRRGRAALATQVSSLCRCGLLNCEAVLQLLTCHLRGTSECMQLVSHACGREGVTVCTRLCADVPVCVCVCVLVCAHLCVNIVCGCACAHASVCACVCVYACACVRVYVTSRVWLCMYVPVCVCVHMKVWTRVGMLRGRAEE